MAFARGLFSAYNSINAVFLHANLAAIVENEYLCMIYISFL